jgi:site-specific DNA-methyltransferase (adenine-specific)
MTWTSVERFLNDRVALHAGDCREVLEQLEENSIDSCVTDPPYHLTSIVKRFGGTDAAPAQFGSDGRYARASAGFMGKIWDGGDVAFRPEVWAAVYRVLKPGAHLVAFGGTRTFHRMACAIEDAGFEIRDTVSWLYGSGFPKSHDVSKGIDRRKDWAALPQLQQAIRTARQGLDISQSEAARRMGLIPADEDLGGGGFMWFETGMRMPTREQWPRLKATLGISDGFDGCFEAAEREITGTVEEWRNRSNYALTSADGFRRDMPATDAARQWEGWGTALKPACELIVLARKPLSEGTVAANVLRWGTGAINVDGCRVAGGGPNGHGGPRTSALHEGGQQIGIEDYKQHLSGRWPANVVHDGSDEVTAAFPESDHARGNTSPTKRGDSDLGWMNGGISPTDSGDSGSAARYFYTAKADAMDRVGSRHPTIKPLDLMQWLVRLVTPKGGTTLDSFAGTGTTGEAAWREGMRALLIEAEPEYQADIRRRMALALAGPDERNRESIKAKNLPRDEGPLFASRETWAEMWAKPFDFSREPKA